MKKLIYLFIINYSLLITYCYSQWTRQTIPVTKPIVGIEFTDTSNGWAVTSAGSQFDVAYVLNSTNGGTNWLVQFTGTDYDFDAFDMVDLNTGYIIGGQFSGGFPRFFKTTNSGQNWIVSDPGVGIIFDDIFFPSRDSGFICASNSFAPGLWFTSNGGTSWQLRTTGVTGMGFTTLFFLNNSTGWCGTTTGRIAGTTNAGVNWTVLQIFQPYPTSIFFINTAVGWASFTNNRIRFTSNGGSNWITQPSPTTGSSTLHEIYFYNSQTGWLGSGFQVIYKTTNGGNNWGYQIDSAASTEICFLDSSIGWTALITTAKTTNGGGPIFYIGFTPEGYNVPKDFKLFQNYPNPFNPFTTIKLDLAKKEKVTMFISDVLGRVKYEIVNQTLSPGTYTFNWDSRDYASGVYFYTLVTQSSRETKKMLLVK